MTPISIIDALCLASPVKGPQLSSGDIRKAKSLCDLPVLTPEPANQVEQGGILGALISGPFELLIKVFDYLDEASLFAVSEISRSCCQSVCAYRMAVATPRWGLPQAIQNSAFTFLRDFVQPAVHKMNAGDQTALSRHLKGASTFQLGIDSPMLRMASPEFLDLNGTEFKILSSWFAKGGFEKLTLGISRSHEFDGGVARDSLVYGTIAVKDVFGMFSCSGSWKEIGKFVSNPTFSAGQVFIHSSSGGAHWNAAESSACFTDSGKLVTGLLRMTTRLFNSRFKSVLLTCDVSHSRVSRVYTILVHSSDDSDGGGDRDSKQARYEHADWKGVLALLSNPKAILSTMSI